MTFAVLDVISETLSTLAEAPLDTADGASDDDGNDEPSSRRLARVLTGVDPSKKVSQFFVIVLAEAEAGAVVVGEDAGFDVVVVLEPQPATRATAANAAAVAAAKR